MVAARCACASPRARRAAPSAWASRRARSATGCRTGRLSRTQWPQRRAASSFPCREACSCSTAPDAPLAPSASAVTPRIATSTAKSKVSRQPGLQAIRPSRRRTGGILLCNYRRLREQKVARPFEIRLRPACSEPSELLVTSREHGPSSLISPWHRTCVIPLRENFMGTQPGVKSAKKWPVRPGPPPRVTSLGGDVPTAAHAITIRGPRVPTTVLRLLLPIALLLLGSAYWLATIWAQALIQREAEVTAATIQPDLQRVPLGRILDARQRERAEWRWQDDLARMAATLPRTPRVTLWDANNKIVWTQDRQRHPGQLATSEVTRALGGEVHARMAEGSLLPPSIAGAPPGMVVETFMPVRGPDKVSVLGVLGLAQRNEALEAHIVQGQRFIGGVA